MIPRLSRWMSASVLLLPGIALAATTATNGKSFRELVYGPILKIGNQLVALMYALAFIAFLIGMVRFVFSHDSEKRENGKKFAIYSIIGLVVLFSLWGIVRFFLGALIELNA